MATRTKRLRIVLTPEEEDLMKQEADRNDLPPATWARAVLLKEARKDGDEPL